ncbi:hypothetical protein CWI38_0032p0070 [Hamiltosporidium tvaerminnensis]|uniref:Reverse transcriptase n=2 Tax=Hamiltosporidium TaxID=1176354 RepID=A0A4V2JYC7_9MICR|nr:hypothetical protein CWI38_0048p0040 [Hamiltosporidium tvaerminnensis]TBU20702.1 hypothetical protein CWI38_0032p0070 [Hamiltosporidium tvaerminnensis]
MDPLSRKLNEKCTKVTIQADAESHATNHLLFIHDLKLLAEDWSTLEEMTKKVKNFMNNIGLEINKEKSTTNDPCCEDTATLLEGIDVYKYLGIIEDSRGIPTSKSFEEVQTKLIVRVERLCCTRLNSKNLFQAINQHAISLLNYLTGVLAPEPADFYKLDYAVRAVLVKNKIHLCPECKERLHSVEFKSEHMLLPLLDSAILKVVNNNKTHLSLIKNFLKIKYGLEKDLYNARKNEIVSVSDSLRWLKKENIRPRDEAVFAESKIEMYSAEQKTTRCDKMLGHDYTRRHNEVVRCIHLLLLNKYKSHSVQEIFDNEYAEIRVDTRLKTDTRYNYFRQETEWDNPHQIKTEKLRKYDLLANELGLIYKCSVEIIPYVMTWDGIRLQIPMNIEAYIQSIVLKKTVETISFDRRRLFIDEEDLMSLGAEIHKQPISHLKLVDNEEDDLEDEIEVVETVERII